LSPAAPLNLVNKLKKDALMSIKAGCFDGICSGWEQPTVCQTYCDTSEARELFDGWWEAVTEWLFEETCGQFPGCCPAETEPCPPCQCKCLNYCGCGPWGTIPLSEAFCYPVCLNDDGEPLLEIVFPQEDGTSKIIKPGDDTFQLRPDMCSLDFCEPISTDHCSGSWPAQDHCGKPWTIRATVGAAPPKMLLLGAAQFVNEIVKDCQNKENCLPKGVRSITRRGVTMDVGDQFSETINFETKNTGVHQLDLALRKWGNCDEGMVRILDPLRRLHEKERRVWTFRGRLNPAELSNG
jgi:hypothetical protein